jgi:hypothetical protein
LVFIFSFEQIILAGPPAPIFEKPVMPEAALDHRVETDSENDSSRINGLAKQSSVATQDFLRQTLMLTPVDDVRSAVDEELNPVSGKNFEPSKITASSELSAAPSRPVFDYEAERYDLEDALPILEQRIPSAFILKAITSADIETLSKLAFESALAILDGEIVLFSSGDEVEIKAGQPVLDLLDNAKGIIHFHVEGHEQDGPSVFDIHNAVQAPQQEYVVTSQGVYAYNQNGALNPEAPESYSEWVMQYQLIVSQERQQYRDQVQARKQLNEFISQMDLIAQTPANDLLTFREAIQDTFPPAGSVVINGGSSYTNSGTETSLSPKKIPCQRRWQQTDRPVPSFSCPRRSNRNHASNRQTAASDWKQ